MIDESELIVEGRVYEGGCDDCGGVSTIVAGGIPGQWGVVVTHQDWCPANAEEESE